MENLVSLAIGAVVGYFLMYFVMPLFHPKYENLKNLPWYGFLWMGLGWLAVLYSGGLLVYTVASKLGLYFGWSALEDSFAADISFFFIAYRWLKRRTSESTKESN